MKEEFYKKIMKAEKYIKNGDPLKDALDEDEVIEAILLLAKMLRAINR